VTFPPFFAAPSTQLRFLLATPRKAAPHIFTQRDYRGQRTSPDDFHPAWNTYVCQPKGEKTSHDVMLELMLHSAQNNAASHLFPIVELWNPATNDRLKLAGDEIILRPSDLAAAQEAFAKEPLDGPRPNYKALNPSKAKTRETEMAKVLSDLQTHPAVFLHFTPLFTADHSFKRCPVCQEWIDAYNGQPVVDQPGKVLALEAEDKEAFTVLKISIIDAPNPVNEVPANSPSLPVSQSPAQPSVLDRVRTEIQANGKATATQLANTLGISAPAIKDAVASANSGLQNKGGWISLIPIE
jgi:hypothetical protein